MNIAYAITSFKQLTGDLLTPGSVPGPVRGVTGKKKKKKKMAKMMTTIMIIMMIMMMIIIVLLFSAPPKGVVHSGYKCLASILLYS